MGPRLIILLNDLRLKPGIEPAIPGGHGGFVAVYYICWEAQWLNGRMSECSSRGLGLE